MYSVARSSFVAIRTVSPLLAARTPSAALAATARRNMTTFEEREKGEETVYMRREDKKLLAKLIKKYHKEEHTAKEDLLEILGDHKLPDDVIDKLLHWKST